MYHCTFLHFSLVAHQSTRGSILLVICSFQISVLVLFQSFFSHSLSLHQWCQGPVEGEAELNAQVERLAVSQVDASSSAPSLPANPDELTTEQRAEITWRALFTYGLAGVYFTAKPRTNASAGRLSNDV